jgi:transcriptional regulator with XRE-family HTH domain
MAKYVDNEGRRASHGLTPALAGLRIRAVMTQRGLSQTAIAKFIGVSQTAVSRWCLGLDVPTEVNLTRLAAGLGVAPDFLSAYRPEFVAALTRAVRPGEFLTEAEDAAIRQAERAARDAPLREAAEQKEAARQREAARLEEEVTRHMLREALRATKGNWRSRLALAGNRCMFCAVQLGYPGTCAACTSGDVDDV